MVDYASFWLKNNHFPGRKVFGVVCRLRINSNQMYGCLQGNSDHCVTCYLGGGVGGGCVSIVYESRKNFLYVWCLHENLYLVV